MDSMREKDELSQKRPNQSKWSNCMHHSIPKHTRVIWSLSNFETMIEVALQTNSNLPSIAQSYGQQLPSHIGNNASHTGATIQACAWERNPVLCIICTKLFEAIIVGTIDIAVYDIHVVWAVCSRCTSSSQVPQPLLLSSQLGNLTTQEHIILCVSLYVFSLQATLPKHCSTVPECLTLSQCRGGVDILLSSLSCPAWVFPYFLQTSWEIGVGPFLQM